MALENHEFSLTLPVIYNGKDLFDYYDPDNNSFTKFGTTLLDVLFTKNELATNMVEPNPNKKGARPALDQDKVNLIKGIYFSFSIFFSLINFVN